MNPIPGNLYRAFDVDGEPTVIFYRQCIADGYLHSEMIVPEGTVVVLVKDYTIRIPPSLNSHIIKVLHNNSIYYLDKMFTYLDNL